MVLLRRIKVQIINKNKLLRRIIVMIRGLDYFVATGITREMRANNIPNCISEMPVGDLHEILESLNMEGKYSAENILKACEYVGDDGSVKDGYGVNPYLSVNGKFAIDVFQELLLTDTEMDVIAARALKEYNDAELIFNEKRQALTAILGEDKYKSRIAGLNEDVNKIAAIVCNYFRNPVSPEGGM